MGRGERGGRVGGMEWGRMCISDAEVRKSVKVDLIHSQKRPTIIVDAEVRLSLSEVLRCV
jgi:hypothetical protein